MEFQVGTFQLPVEFHGIIPWMPRQQYPRDSTSSFVCTFYRATLVHRALTGSRVRMLRVWNSMEFQLQVEFQWNIPSCRGMEWNETLQLFRLSIFCYILSMVDGVAFSIPNCFQFWIGLHTRRSFQCLLA